MPRGKRKAAETPPVVNTGALAPATGQASIAIPGLVSAADALPLHSPLGASSAERWMNCPGSTALARAIGPTDDVDDPEYRRDGIMAHELAAACLKGGDDAWELMDGFPLVTPEMAQAVQLYLNYVRQQSEIPFAGIEIIDYKHGEGIIVDPDENPQLSYYGFGFLDGKTVPNCGELFVEQRVHLPEFHPMFFGTVDCAVVNLSKPHSTGDYADDEPVRLTIVQPRIPWHPRGIIRSWDTTAGALRKWAYEVLRPAMEVAQMTFDFALGDWCRFCPAKRLCPLMREAVDEAIEQAVDGADELAVTDMTEAQLAHYWGRHQAVKHFYKMLDERVFRILSAGGSHPELAETVKVVNKITYRVWKPDTEKKVVKRLGKENAYTKPELISPAAAEKLIGLDGPAVVAEYATTPPPTGLTLAPISDTRAAVVIQTIEEKFPLAAPAELW